MAAFAGWGAQARLPALQAQFSKEKELPFEILHIECIQGREIVLQ